MNKNSKRFTMIVFLLSTLSIFTVGFTLWMVRTFGDVDFEQYLFSITAPTAGTPKSFYIEIAVFVVIIMILSIVLTIGLKSFVYNTRAIALRDSNPSRFTRKKGILITMVASLVLSILFMNYKLKITSYLSIPDNTFIQNNYKEPTTKILEFPKQKKNLIYIYLESFEATYFSKELGGNIDKNLIPNLTAIMQEPTTASFSHTDKFGGGFQAPSTGFSIAGMFAQQSGLPFKVPVKGNDYGQEFDFIPGSITLGDILQHEGYNLQLVVGADGTFAGVNNFYETHGNFDILDWPKAKQEGRIPNDYKEWWGFEDRKLFAYGKEYLDVLSSQDEPFALVLEADDSHYPHGYTDASCPQPYEQPYENSISCVDSMVNEFINYVKAQDYYKDTVIVVHGDHLSMEKEYFKHIDQDYKRTTFNAYINVDNEKIKNANMKNRAFYSMDVFPTLLSAMNVEISGDQLGIGTDLFSKTPTLYEELGVTEIDEHLRGKSTFFTRKFLQEHNSYK